MRSGDCDPLVGDSGCPELPPGLFAQPPLIPAVNRAPVRQAHCDSLNVLAVSSLFCLSAGRRTVHAQSFFAATDGSGTYSTSREIHDRHQAPAAARSVGDGKMTDSIRGGSPQTSASDPNSTAANFGLRYIPSSSNRVRDFLKTGRYNASYSEYRVQECSTPPGAKALRIRRIRLRRSNGSTGQRTRLARERSDRQ